MARNFNGTSDYYVGGSAVISAPPGTIAAWFRPNVTNAFLNIAGQSNGSSATQIFRLVVNSTGKLQAQFRNNGSSLSSVLGTTTPSTTAFQHGVATFDASGVARVYYNGALEGTGSAPSNTTVTFNQTDVGAWVAASPGNFFDGDIAEVAMWSAQLDAAEIAALAKGYSPARIRPASLVFYPRLIRDIIDLKGLALTTTGTTVSDHPRIIGGRKRSLIGRTAATGGGTTSGTSAATSGATGTLTGDGALSGTSAATSGATGTVANGAAGSLTGTSAATSGATATLTAIGALIGSSQIVSNATGTLIDAIGHLSGTVAASSGATGTLRDGNPNNIWQAVSPASGTWTSTAAASGSWTAAS